jgi:hypothetical protein
MVLVYDKSLLLTVLSIGPLPASERLHKPILTRIVRSIVLYICARGMQDLSPRQTSLYKINYMATQLYFKVDGRWRLIMTIPNDDFNRFTTRALAWLRFLGYAIYGRDGILKMRPNSQEVNSYDTDVADLNSQYYYVSPGR